jgi:hypothetical protein
MVGLPCGSRGSRTAAACKVMTGVIERRKSHLPSGLRLLNTCRLVELKAKPGKT